MTRPNATLSESIRRRRAIGAENQPQGGTHFRVWAPGKDRIRVVLCDEHQTHLGGITLEPEEKGYFAGWVAEAQVDALYGFLINESSQLLPDPASRYQPYGPTGPSQVIDPDRFHWSDAGWKGVSREGQIIYEMHFGTFTPEGTYSAASEQLHELADLGVTLLEVMPLAEFPGRFGWGYDGVCLFAQLGFMATPMVSGTSLTRLTVAVWA